MRQPGAAWRAQPRRLALLALALATLWAASLPARALPRFAARTGASCDACHVNPTGGGMRNRYGSDVYARTVLPLWPQAAPGLPTGWSPGPHQRLAAGADLRAGLVGIDSQVAFDPTTGTAWQVPEVLSFFLMQADLYATVDANRYLALYADYGLASKSMEIFGLLRAPVADSYLKVGAFVPPYGLKLANHRVYIREDALGIDANLREAGVELGTHPGPLRVIGAVMNGGGGAIGLNPDYRIALAGMADLTVRSGSFAGTLGASAWWEPGGAVVGGVDQTTLDRRLGAYWTLSAGRLTLLGELDHRQTKDAAAEEEGALLAAYHELAVLPVQGVDLLVTYEYLDPDLTLRPNALHRVGGGVELFPVSHAELTLLVRHTLADEEALDDPRTFYVAGALSGMTDLSLFLHLYL